MRYNQQLDYRRKKRFVRRVWTAFVVVLIAILVFIAFLFYENYKASNYNSPEQTTSAPTSSYIAPNIQIFRSPYFQFQTDKSWTEDPGSSKDGKYVYRSLRGGLLEQQLTVYINSAPSNLAVTHVLVATTNGNRGLTTKKVSDHCGSALKVKASSAQVTLDQVTFTCFGDDTRFNVLVGLAGGTPAISLPRPDGSTATYTIQYANLTSTPNANPLQEIVNSFQTR